MSPPLEQVCDVVVVGAGPAGLAAAAAASGAGRRVIVLDQGIRPGGQIWRHRDRSALPTAAHHLMNEAKRSVIIPGARVIDGRSPHDLLVDVGGVAHRVRATALVIATGARERFVPFPGWTLPGVVGIGGLQALIKSGLDVKGARIVIAGTGPLLLPVAATAARAGANVRIVAEQVPFRRLARFGLSMLGRPRAIAQAIRYRIAFRHSSFATDSWILRAEGSSAVNTVLLRRGGAVEHVACDWLATSAGLIPDTELAQLFGCAIGNDAIVVDAEQGTSVAGVWAAGECTGVAGDAAAIVEGTIAGAAAAGSNAVTPRARRHQESGRAFARRLELTFAPRPELLALADATTVLCRCEDIAVGAIDPSWSQRQAKLWTRVGMGECQGAVCGPACQSLFGWTLNRPRAPLGTPRCATWADALQHANPDDAR
ncbi:MAG TPA: FAD/NAD(P)-binding oxidoreductase [Gemmatimonadales bacterium]|jgi:NADPH-dependent 2,4-dienoyl-CoA reductase/sulfur reductase-like enzyme